MMWINNDGIERYMGFTEEHSNIPMYSVVISLIKNKRM
jgi:hypothetical protein